MDNKNNDYVGKYFSFERNFKQRIPADWEKEWWIAVSASGAGALLQAGKGNQLLHLRSFDGGIFYKLISKCAPEKIILAYDGFKAAECKNYAELLRTLATVVMHYDLNFDLLLYIPENSQPTGQTNYHEIDKGTFKTIKIDKTFQHVLTRIESRIGNEATPIKMPFFDLGADVFSFGDFYNFCCDKFTYLFKHELFPKLDFGMSNFNAGLWNAHGKSIPLSGDTLHSQYNFNMGQTFPLQKLLETATFEKKMEFLLGKTLPLLAKNKLFDTICIDGVCLFPLVLFLGGRIRRFHDLWRYGDNIAEYNFHELIQALAAVIKGEECPELMPDIPGEEEISLINRNGTRCIKLQPVCKNYSIDGDTITAEFRNVDLALDFIENCSYMDCEFCLADTAGKVFFRTNDLRLPERLEHAKNYAPEYWIKMRILEGETLRSMTAKEIISDSASRIINHFQGNILEALRYLDSLSEHFKDQFKRFSVVKNGESDMTSLGFIRVHGGSCGLHRNFFRDMFQNSMLDLLTGYAFSDLEISISEEQNKVVFEASKRKSFGETIDASWPLIFAIIGGMSTWADFSIEYKDGSLRKISVKDAVVYDKNLFPLPTNTMTRFECSFVLPDKYPIDDNIVFSMVHKFSRVFPHCHITLNGCENIDKSEKKNKITWFLHHRHFAQDVAKIFEFNENAENYNWEISFSCDGVKKNTSFINGIETGRGGTHIQMVKKCIRQVLQKISGKKSISLNGLNLALSFHVPWDGISFDRSWPTIYDDLKLVSTPPELHLIKREFSRQMTAYFTAHPNDLYEILKKCE